MGSGQIQPVDLRPLQPYPVPRGDSRPGTAGGDDTFGRVIFQKLVIDLTIASPGGGLNGPGNKREDIRGTGLIIVKNAGANAVIEVQRNGEGDFIPYEKGTGPFNPAPFEFVCFRWDAQPGVIVTFCYWTDRKDGPIE